MSTAKRSVDPSASPSAAPVPLVIGITGHIDLRPADQQALEDQVRVVFDDIRRRHDDPARGAVEPERLPLVLLSSLAEGADRLAARVALDCGAQVVAVLPMPRDHYIKTFPNSVADFDALLKRAEQTIIIPWADPERKLADDERRDLQYLLAGAYIARHSRHLIALWDGIAKHKTGGTSQIVAYRRTGKLDLDQRLAAYATAMPLPYGLQRKPLDPPETGPLYHIPTPRLSNLTLKQVGEIVELAPEGYEDEAWRKAYFERLDEINRHNAAFNEDALKLLPDRQADVETNRRYLFPDEQAARLPASLQTLRQTYAMADTLAIHFQRLTYHSLNIIFMVIFAVVLVFGFYAHLLREPHHLWLLTFYLVLLAAADVYYLTARRRDYQNKFQDYRALAEGLRVQFFWKLAGLPDSVSDHYFRKQKSELAWIPNAIQACSLLAEPAARSDPAAVRKHWIEDQRLFFHRRSKRDHNMSVRHKERGNGLLLVSLTLALYEIIYHTTHPLMTVLGMAVVLVGLWHLWNKLKEIKEEAKLAGDFVSPAIAHKAIRQVSLESWRYFFFGVLIGAALVGALLGARFFVGHLEGLTHLFKEDMHDWIVIAMGLTALAAALSHDYVNKRAFTEHHKQYRRMEELFKYAKEQFNEAAQHHQTDELDALVRELGEEALAEHGDWVLLHRERPLELPKAEI